MKHSILIVDDEVDNVDALERLFRKKYNVLRATSAAQALEHVRNSEVAVIISDQRMPKMTGVQFLAESIKLRPEAIRMLLTGYTDIESAIEAINTGGIYRYITKPWDSADLANAVDKAVEKFELRRELESKNAALEKALEELRGLDEAKNRFMILINHELKTPLTVLMSFLDLLSETELGGDQSKYLEKIKKSSDRLQQIIDDVLKFVSAETGLLKVSRKKLSAQKVANALAEKYRESAEKKGVSIVLPKDDVKINADPLILEDTLSRLIDNAIKFGEKDSNVELSWELVKNSDQIELSVTNKGKALSKETIENILRPFSLDEDILKHSQGLGLGLSLAQALLRRHESSLKIECPKGHVKVSFAVERA